MIFAITWPDAVALIGLFVCAAFMTNSYYKHFYSNDDEKEGN